MSHNPDIDRLVDKGLSISITGNYLVVQNIFYLDSQKELCKGALISVFTGTERIQMQDHQMYFCGTHPCFVDGSSITGLGGGPLNPQLKVGELIAERSFSHKKTTNGAMRDYLDWYEKVMEYVGLICTPPMDVFGEQASPFKYSEFSDQKDLIFHFRDTLTSRAFISDLAQRFENEVIGIIGLGGTGSYILDFMVKTRVKEIRGFDVDLFYAHNAFRSPGKTLETELEESKAKVYQERYENFRTGISFCKKNIVEGCEEDLMGCTFVFVSVDKGEARRVIFEILQKLKIPFIDVGMGLNRNNDVIGGQLRTTYFDPENAAKIIAENWAPLTDGPDHVYRRNIQIAELNALNACIAVMKYKKLMGFYAHDETSYNIGLNIDSTRTKHND
ncbi:MAG: ThiF family adenylyltransferase [bacterium]|nr:ThiF family adenylyltransferase [bacterium]